MMSDMMSESPETSPLDPEPITVVLVEDSPFFRRGIVQELDQDPAIRLLAVAANAAQGLRQVRELRPRVALVDLRLRADEESRSSDTAVGLGLLWEIRCIRPTRAIVFSQYTQPAWVRLAAKAGAYGLLDKDESPQEVREAIHRVAQGVPVWTAEQQSWLQRAEAVRLTPREEEILALVAAGLPDQEIARRLGIRPGTVGKHLESIRSKLQARNRFEAVIRARRLGILPPDDGTWS